MTRDDLLFIASQCYAIKIDQDSLIKMIEFNDRINREVCIEKRWGNMGAPWEFNLRDLFRWCDLIVNERFGVGRAGDFVYLIYASRFRTEKDRSRVYELFREIFNYDAYKQDDQCVKFAKTHLQVGQSFLHYNKSIVSDEVNLVSCNYSLTNKNLKHLESIIKCIEMNWLVILAGHSCVGKTSLIRLLASLSNRKLIEFSVNNATDTSDLLGGFEKIKHLKQDLETINNRVKYFYLKHIKANNGQHLKVYFGFLYESKRLYKEFGVNSMNEDNGMNDSETVTKFLNLYESNLKKLQNLQSVVKSPSDKVEIEELIAKCETLKASNSKSNSTAKQSNQMKFEWIDSSLVRAIESGDWVLIDNANFCPPSVLDRLNPLLERNGGILQINEKGIFF